MIYVSGLLLAGIGFLLWALLRNTKQLGKEEVKEEILEHESDAMASRPISDADLINVLRSKAANKPENSSK